MRLIRFLSTCMALAGLALGVGGPPVRAANILVVAGTDALAITAANRLDTDLSGTNTVTIAQSGVPASLASYTQIFDVRYSNVPALTPTEQASYVAYLGAAPGNVLFLMGENAGGSFAARNQAICDLIALAGGGTIAKPAANGSTETVNPAFGTSPNAITTVRYAAVGLLASSGNGSFATTEAGGGGAVFFNQGTLANALTGALVAVFDVNFIYDAQNRTGTNEIPFRQNLESFFASGGNLGTVPVLSASANPIAAFGSVTFTATIGGGADGTTVSFLDGATLLGTGTLAGGTASFTTTQLPAGTHPIKATYLTGSGITLNSLVLSEVVSAFVAPVLTASANPAPVLGPVTLTATVSGGADGTVVDFLDGDALLGTGTLSGGVAAFTTADLALGSHALTAAYTPGATTLTSPVLPLVITTVFKVAPPEALAVNGGDAGSVSFTLDALGVGSHPVTLSASGLPAGATCDFSTNGVDLSGGAVAVTATFTTTPRLAIVGRNRGLDPLGGIGAGALLGCGILAMAGGRRRRLGLFLSVLALVLVGGLTACSSRNGSRGATTGSVPTPPGTYPIVLTASAQGATLDSQTIQLTVN